MKDVRTNLFSLVLFGTDNFEFDKGEIKRVFSKIEEMGFKYYACFHFQDKNENGDDKPKHWHIIIKSEKPLRISTLLASISLGYLYARENEAIVSVDSRLSIDKGFNIIGLIRYLIHMDNPEKFQYPTEAIVTNDELGVQAAFCGEYTITDVINVAISSKSFLEFITNLPSDFVRRNAYLCNMIWRSRND